MTKETAKRFAPLVQALADGKTIERYNGVRWMEDADPAFTGHPDLYRVQEPLLECWANVHSDGATTYHALPDHPANNATDYIIRTAHLVEVRP